MKKLVVVATMGIIGISLSSCAVESVEQVAEAKITCAVLGQTLSRIDISGLSREAAEARFSGAAMSLDALVAKDIPKPLGDSISKLSFAYKDFVSRYQESKQALSETIAEIDYASEVVFGACSKYLK